MFKAYYKKPYKADLNKLSSIVKNSLKGVFSIPIMLFLARKKRNPRVAQQREHHASACHRIVQYSGIQQLLHLPDSSPEALPRHLG